MYLGWLFGLGLCLAAAGFMVQTEYRRTSARLVALYWPAFILAAAAGVLSVLPLMRGYLAASHHVGVRTFAEAFTMLPRPQSWLFTGSRVYRWMKSQPLMMSLPMQHEQMIGIGLLTSAVALAGLLMPGAHSKSRRTILAASLLLAGLTTLWPGGITAWGIILRFFPGAAAIRAVARVGILLLVPASIGLACFFESCPAPLAVVLALLIGAEQMGRCRTFDKPEGRARIERLTALVAPRGRCAAFFAARTVEAGPAAPSRPDQAVHAQVDAMWAALDSGVPAVNGYSGGAPPGWRLDDPLIETPADRARISDALDSWSASRGIDKDRLCRIEVPLR
jgi:hypothetical protein